MTLNNPFLHSSFLADYPMTSRYSQMVYFFAMRDSQAESPYVFDTDGVPFSSPIEVAENGSVFLTQQAQIEALFQGVTVAVYDAILHLYLSSVGRSYKIVHTVLCRMAAAADAEAPSLQAVWAICQNATPKYRQKFKPTVVFGESAWRITTTTVSITAVYKPEVSVSEMVAVVIWDGSAIVGAGLVRQAHLATEVSIILYEAIAVNRVPDPYSQRGILWRLPYLIQSPESIMNAIEPACRQSGMQVALVSEGDTVLERIMAQLHHDWTQNMPTKAKSYEDWRLIFDTYLQRTHGYGPASQFDHQQDNWRNHPYLSQDAGSLFPELRWLLPSYPVVIHDDGVFYHDGIRYVNPLLTYWKNETLLFRPSPFFFQRGWIYAEDEVICELKPLYEAD